MNKKASGRQVKFLANGFDSTRRLWPRRPLQEGALGTAAHACAQTVCFGH